MADVGYKVIASGKKIEKLEKKKEEIMAKFEIHPQNMERQLRQVNRAIMQE